MAKLDVVAFSDSGAVVSGSLVGTSSPVSIAVSVTEADGEPVADLGWSFGVTLIAPVLRGFPIKITDSLEVAKGRPPAVPPKEKHRGFYVLEIEPQAVQWSEGDYVFGVRAERRLRSTRTDRPLEITVDRGQTLVTVHIA